jgi:hypothetical protein
MNNKLHIELRKEFQMERMILSLLIILLACCPVSYSQSQRSTGILQTVDPGSENLSAERLNKIDTQINQWIKE